MKAMLLAAAALVIAAPALAQSDPGMFPRVAASASASYAATGSIGTTRRNTPSATNPAYTVFDEYGQVVGADPDPNIRMQLHRESDFRE